MKTFKLAGTVILILVAAIYHLRGCSWGVPDRERIELVVGSEKRLEELIPLLTSLHQELEEIIPYYGQRYPGTYEEKEMLTVRISGRSMKIRKDFLNAVRSFLLRSYGADEHRALLALSRMNPAQWNFDPRFYEYGGVYLYPLAGFLKLCSLTNVIRLKSQMEFYLRHPEEMGRIFVFSRIFGATGAVLAAGIFFLLITDIAGAGKEAFLLALHFALLPVFVLWSFHLKPFSFGMIWVVATLYQIRQYQKKKETIWLWLGSIFSGLAMGTLLSYGYVFWAVVLAIFMYPEVSCGRGKAIFSCFVIFLTVFVLFNPCAVWHWRQLAGEILFLKNYWHTGSWQENFCFFFSHTLRTGMGTALYAIAGFSLLAGMFYWRGKEDWFWLFYLLPGLLYFAYTTGNWMHYSFFLYPVFLILPALFVRKIKTGWWVKLVLVFSLGWTWVYTSALVNLYRGENLRTAAGRWINQNIPEHASIGLTEPPSPWRTPPFRFLNYHLVIAADEEIIAGKIRPEWFISCQETWGRGGSFSQLSQKLGNYRVVATFRKPAKFLWLSWFFPEKIPYDLCHPNPVIHIWRRK